MVELLYLMVLPELSHSPKQFGVKPKNIVSPEFVLSISLTAPGLIFSSLISQF